MSRRRLWCASTAACLAFAFVVGVEAQAPLTAPASDEAKLFTRSDFSFSWAALANGDPRFSWDARIGLDIDLVDYRTGRLNFAAGYEAILGSERRAFDLNHGNYTLEASSSYRVRAIELAAVFHHVSRHLNDRDNPATIAWNVAEVRASRRVAVGKTTIEGQLEAGRVLQHTYVDYVWTSDLRLVLRRPLTDRTALFAGASGGLIGVDRARLDRDRQCGARLETGVHISGKVAALELFAGYERRIDAYPLDRHRTRWFAAGFRFVSR
jgi:hypothetical protein